VVVGAAGLSVVTDAESFWLGVGDLGMTDADALLDLPASGVFSAGFPDTAEISASMSSCDKGLFSSAMARLAARV
jgi:hypothetical protein